MAETNKLVLPDRSGMTGQQDGSIQFIGTATTVIHIGGFTILTDPNFVHAGTKVPIGYGLTAERLTDPAIEISQLPSLDLCILSHMHGDHWDDVATEQLRKDLPIITTREAATDLSSKGFTQTMPLDRWESVTVERKSSWLRITALPAQHAPSVLKVALPPVIGTMLEWSGGHARPEYRLYISGDTILFDDLQEIPRRYPEIDLALLHLGGTQVMGLVVTMDAEQGIRAIRIIQPHEVVPIHYNDYDVFKSPIEDFLKAASTAGFESRVHFLKHGETFRFVPQAGREVS